MKVNCGQSTWSRPGRVVPLVALVAAWICFASPALACFDDTDCDDWQVCSGAEWCDLSGGSPGFCMAGTPIVCDDSDPCTSDYCEEPTGFCIYTPSPDAESAAGPDGLCGTFDDNLDLYGLDGSCGTGDDLTGDGICANLDNCDDRSNPGQEDNDRDRIGDACDPSPCRARGLYAFSGSSLYKVDPSTGAATYVASGFNNPRDVAIDSTETLAVVTGGTPGNLYVVDLATGSIDNTFGVSGPWGVEIGSVSNQAYYSDYFAGEIWGFDLFGGIYPIAFGLIFPNGIDVNSAETTAYVAEDGGDLWSVSLPGGTLSPVASGLAGPRAVNLDPTETDLFVIEATSGNLSRVSVATGTPTIVASGLVDPEGLTLDAAGTIAYVTESSTGFQTISAVDLSTGVVTPIPQDPFFIMSYNDGLELSPRPPVVLSLPANEEGLPAGPVVVPVTLDDVTGLGVLSVDFTVAYNPAVLAISSVSLGPLATGCTLTENLTVPGQAVVSIFCSSDLSGSGTLAYINYTVAGDPGEGSPLDLTSVLLNEGTPHVCGSDGTFFVPVDIEGVVVYYRDHVTSTEPSTKVVDAVNLTLERLDWDDMLGPVYTEVGTTVTDCSGDYFQNGNPPIVTYRLTPDKTNDFEGAVDPFDAALNAQHVVGLITLTANQSLAADVTGNGTLTSFDSARIAQFSIGWITQFPVAILNGSDWAFVPAPAAEPNQTIVNPYPQWAQPGRIEYSPIIESAENQDFHAILYGDVSGNWVGVCGSPSAPPPEMQDAAAPGRSDKTGYGSGGKTPGKGLLSLPLLHAAPGEEIRVPIRVEDAAEAISFLLDLRYDPEVLELVGTGVGEEASAFQLQANTTETGRARMALFSATQLGRDGDIVTVTFRVVGAPRSRTDLTLSTTRVNEGGIPVTVRPGRVVVLPRPSRP